jgi:hypothetical protein
VEVIALLREQLKEAHQFLEATMADVTPEQAQWTPPGTALPLGAIYVHGVCAEDFAINQLLKGGQALYASAFADTSGISSPQPYISPDWARGLRLDLPQARRYAQAVYDATDAYVSGLAADALDQTIDLSSAGWGSWPLHFILSRMVVGHIDNMTGEISCLKGLQGAKGYPNLAWACDMVD